MYVKRTAYLDNATTQYCCKVDYFYRIICKENTYCSFMFIELIVLNVTKYLVQIIVLILLLLIEQSNVGYPFMTMHDVRNNHQYIR